MLTSMVAPTYFRQVFPPAFPSKNNPTMCSAQRPNNLQWKPRQLDKTIDSFSGKLSQGGLVFQQNFLIRSYELDPNGKVSILALLNYLQESSLNHLKSVGLSTAQSFGLTAEMIRRNLIWVVYRLQIVVERQPSWADVVQVESWIPRPGKRDWLVRDYKTGETILKATSLFLMMNTKTRRLSLEKEAWAEIEPYVLNCDPIINKDKRKLVQLDLHTADHVRTGIAPLWNDLDVNQHVNHVKYINWILESAPRSVLEGHKLSSITLEYRKECWRDSMLQSLSAVNRKGASHSTEDEWVELDHLLRLEDGSEILRGRTTWMPKYSEGCSV